MTIRKYIIVVESEKDNKTFEIEIAPQYLIDAMRNNPSDIWLYINGWLEGLKKL